MYIKEMLNSTNLFNQFRENKFVGNEDEKYVIEALEFMVLKNCNSVVPEELERLNKKIFKYMREKGENTFEAFTNYLLKSNTIKATKIKFNIQVIREKTLKELENIRNEIKQINNKTTQS